MLVEALASQSSRWLVMASLKILEIGGVDLHATALRAAGLTSSAGRRISPALVAAPAVVFSVCYCCSFAWWLQRWSAFVFLESMAFQYAWPIGARASLIYVVQLYSS